MTDSIVCKTGFLLKREIWLFIEEYGVKRYWTYLWTWCVKAQRGVDKMHCQIYKQHPRLRCKVKYRSSTIILVSSKAASYKILCTMFYRINIVSQIHCLGWLPVLYHSVSLNSLFSILIRAEISLLGCICLEFIPNMTLLTPLLQSREQLVVVNYIWWMHAVIFYSLGLHACFFVSTEMPLCLLLSKNYDASGHWIPCRSMEVWEICPSVVSSWGLCQ